MLLISEANFIVIDVETTGSSPIDNRITDIACISINDFEIVNTYCSLVNPHQSIPWYIQRMTGIDYKMVKNAPEPIIVFKNIAELLQAENTFFVAHSVDFDYSFVKETIRRLHIPFKEIPIICSLKLARKVLPSSIKKNVAAVAEYFNIPIINRHRAFDDAFATANFFIEMLHIIRDRYGIIDAYSLLDFQDGNADRITKTAKNFASKLFPYREIIPNQSGVFIFIDKKGEALHITKASNLKKHLEYFIEQCLVSVKKVKEILNHFHRLEWIETNNELETIITEYRKIKQFSPKFNLLPRMDLANANDIQINEKTQKLLSKNLSMIVLLGNSEQEKIIDVYFIKHGMYQTSCSIGRKANLTAIFETIHNIYFDKNLEPEIDIDEMKLVNNWLNKNNSIAKKINISNDLHEPNLFAELENLIRSFW